MEKTVPLKKNNDFIKVFRKGRFYTGKNLFLYALSNSIDENRLGISVSRKVGKSVKRNRVKRLIKESYRLIEDIIKPGYDIVFTAKSSAISADFPEIGREIRVLFKKANLL